MTKEQMKAMENINVCKSVIASTEARLQEAVEEKDWSVVLTIGSMLEERESWLKELEEELSALSDTTEEEIKMTNTIKEIMSMTSTELVTKVISLQSAHDSYLDDIAGIEFELECAAENQEAEDASLVAKLESLEEIVESTVSIITILDTRIVELGEQEATSAAAEVADVEEENKMTNTTRLEEVIQEMHLSLDGVVYDNNAERFNDYRFECLNVSENIDMVIANIIDCGADDAVSLATLAAMKQERLVYIEAANHFSNEADTPSTPSTPVATEEVVAVATPVTSAAAEVADVEEENKMTEQTSKQEMVTLASKELAVAEQVVVDATQNIADAYALGEDISPLYIIKEGAKKVVADLISAVGYLKEDAATEPVAAKVTTASQEASLKELKMALELRHAALTAKFEDAVAHGYEEVATGSVEMAGVYRDMATVLQDQLLDVEAKINKATKQLNKMRIARTVAAPIIATVVAVKTAGRVFKVIGKVFSVIGKIVVRAGKAIASVVRRLFSKTAKTTTAKTTVAVAATVVSRTASGVRKAAKVVASVVASAANAVLGVSIVATAVAHKAGSLLNNVSTVVHAGASSAFAAMKGLRFGKAAV